MRFQGIRRRKQSEMEFAMILQNPYIYIYRISVFLIFFTFKKKKYAPSSVDKKKNAPSSNPEFLGDFSPTKKTKLKISVFGCLVIY